jgi:hypothetical protein
MPSKLTLHPLSGLQVTGRGSPLKAIRQPFSQPTMSAIASFVQYYSNMATRQALYPITPVYCVRLLGMSIIFAVYSRYHVKKELDDIKENNSNICSSQWWSLDCALLASGWCRLPLSTLSSARRPAHCHQHADQHTVISTQTSFKHTVISTGSNDRNIEGFCRRKNFILLCF